MIATGTYELLAIKFAAEGGFRHPVRLSKRLDTMSELSRRSFLVGSATAVAAPSGGLAQRSAALDVAIIGAGAAGIAAARRIAAANRRFVLLEASDRLGGRCVTDTTIFGVPFDLGAHWIHRPDGSLLTGSAPLAAIDIYAASLG